MNLKLLLIVILYILILGLLFYFLDIESNIIILLSIVIILILNKLISKAELFKDKCKDFDTVSTDLDKMIKQLKNALRNIQSKNKPKPLPYKYEASSGESVQFGNIDDERTIVQNLNG